MIQLEINLLGVERKEALERSGLNVDKAWLGAGAAVVLALLLLLGANGFVAGRVAAAEDTVKDNQDKIKKLKEDVKEIKELEKRKADLIAEEKILKYVTGETYRWSYLLQEIRTLMPLDVKIDGLTFQNDNTFSLSGSATDHRSVALFLASLQDSKMIQDVKLQFSTKESPEEATTFQISCKVKAGG